MAVVAEDCFKQAPVLVLSPSKALTAQLLREIKKRFWEKLGAKTEIPVRSLMPNPKSANRLASWLEEEGRQNAVIFATIQGLTQLQRDNPSAFQSLTQHVGTVFFDEGHRKPAVQWADVVRSFNAPTILFTATPFRNDLKMFHVDMEHAFFLSFREAVARRIIRDVDITEIPAGEAQIFARNLVLLRRDLIRAGRYPTTVKVIVRCDNQASVREIANALAAELPAGAHQVLAVHHTFRDGGEGFSNQVPGRLAERDERFLVHQFMLTEGIDDPNCAIVALYEPFSTERQLVQQVGRIIRHPNPTREDAAPGLLVVPNGSKAGSMWDRYLEFDRWCERSLEAEGHLHLRTTKDTVERMLVAVPEMDTSTAASASGFRLLQPD